MQEMNKLYQLLMKIEPEVPFLSPEDQQLFWSYEVAAETGQHELPDTAAENIVRMYLILNKEKTVIESIVDPDSPAEKIASGVVAPLSMVQVVKDLLGAKHMLNPNEATFLSIIAQKLLKRIALSEDETRTLLEVYRKKGF